MELKTHWNGCAIYLVQTDITTLAVDAIVNAANELLWPGGGVCGAIHRRGGAIIAEECTAAIARRGGLVRPGEAEITSGGKLTARHVIHAVGPIFDVDQRAAPTILANAYQNALLLARQLGVKSLAFPCLSTGHFGYPPQEACRVAVRTVRAALEQHGGLAKVIFCTYLGTDHSLYVQQLDAG